MTRFLTFTAAALLATFAFAQEQTPQPSAQDQATPPSDTATAPATAPATQQSGSIFDTLDANQDGNLAQTEADAHPTVAQHFTQADTNGDGALSREEFAAAFKSQ
jgi:Ca2+-binding EF-hand superfamily protein